MAFTTHGVVWDSVERTFFATPYTCALTTSVIPPRTLSSSSAPRASLTTRVLDASPTAPTHPVTQYTASPPFSAWCAKRIRFAVVASMANFRETYLNVTTGVVVVHRRVDRGEDFVRGHRRHRGERCATRVRAVRGALRRCGGRRGAGTDDPFLGILFKFIF